MRKILLLVLFVVLFFACSNDGLDVKRTPGNIFCLVLEQNKCYDVSVEVCEAVGGEEVTSCRPENSSSSADIEVGESSSSSEVDDGDSSSSGDIDIGESSSSSEVDVGDPSSSSEGEVGGSSSSDEGGDGDSSSSSDVVDGSSSSVTAGSSSSVQPSSSSLGPPSLSECNLPSTYMHKGESISLANLVSIEGNSTGCGNVTYRLQVGSSSSTTTISSASISLSNYSGRTLTITASVQCGATGVPSPKTCKSVFVADKYIEFVECGKNFTLTNGTTVFEYRCGEDGTQYYIKCPSDDANFKLSAEGFTETTSTWGGANLPGYPDPYPTIPKDDGLFYFPGRILATVTNAPAGGYSCTSW